MSAIIHHGDCLEVMPTLDADSVDAIVTDPPYHLTDIARTFQGKSGSIDARTGRQRSESRRKSAGFMGKAWDGGDVAFRPETWAEALRVAKPGAYLVAFGGTRTFHRLTCAIEDAGWEIRDCLMFLHGQGFPKSLDVSKAIDKAAGAEREVIGFDAAKHRPNRDKHLLAGQPGGGGKLKADNGATTTAPATDAARQWDGFGTALKPSFEPIILARKPLIGTVAANVQEHGTGALNIDGCRIGTEVLSAHGGGRNDVPRCYGAGKGIPSILAGSNPRVGRWPANVVLDECAAELLDRQSGAVGNHGGAGAYLSRSGFGGGIVTPAPSDTGGASRFFYCAKASQSERNAGLNGERCTHPTVKPLALMRWLARLTTPPGGVVLDPFAGSGSTGIGTLQQGYSFIGIEREAAYVEIARKRIADAQSQLTLAVA
ncbi:MAG: DNA-methyltransferase [Gemmatimonadaceae bacterium]